MSRPFYYGGQAVLEGVMIRGRAHMAVAVRKPDGDIFLHTEPLGKIASGRIARIPFLRGIIVLWETLSLGMRSLWLSANVAAGEDTPTDAGPPWMVAVPSLLTVVALFFVGPLLVVGWLDKYLASSVLSNVIEGVIRLALLLGYIGFIGRIPEIQRVFAYHGAEHKAIHTLEHQEPLDIPHVQAYSTAHPRCGTAFLLTLAVIAIVVFALLGRPPLEWRLLSRVVLIPFIAAISYEGIRLSAALEGNVLGKVMAAPGLALQKMTTREPDAGQVEVAIAALRGAMDADGVAAPAGRGG